MSVNAEGSTAAELEEKAAAARRQPDLPCFAERHREDSPAAPHCCGVVASLRCQTSRVRTCILCYIYMCFSSTQKTPVLASTQHSTCDRVGVLSSSSCSCGLLHQEAKNAASVAREDDLTRETTSVQN